MKRLVRLLLIIAIVVGGLGFYRGWFVLATDTASHFNTFSHEGVLTMNWDQIKGNWMQWTGQIKEKWGKLTDDELTAVAGQRDQLAGLLQERYGYEKAQAHKALNEFLEGLKP